MEKVRSKDGATIAFDRLGDGPAVIVVGGEVMGGGGGTIPVDLIGRVTPPTLVFVGGASPAGTIDLGRQVADEMPNGRHRVLEGQEHVVPPELLAPVLVEFFAD